MAIFILFFNYAFPVASIDVRINREEALKESADFISQHGFDPGAFDKTIIFHSDYHASVYLQKTLGIKGSNELIRQGIPVWFWRTRWFKELEKEGFIVDIDPSSGEIVNYYYFVLEDEEGADLNKNKAMKIAAEEIALQGIELDNYELKDSTIQKQKRRTDYHFVWEKKDCQLEDARLRLRVEIYGDKLGKFRRFLKVPEEFRRYVQGEVSFGRALAMATSIIKHLLIIAAIFILVVKSASKQVKVNWRLWFTCGAIIALLELFDFFNSLPLLWSYYSDTIAKSVFIMDSLGVNLMKAISEGLIIFACGSLAELYSRSFTPFQASRIVPKFIIGYSLGFVFLGYITLFYLIGAELFHIWIPPETEYSNILGMKIPFLFPLTVAVTAAVSEEFLYRLFAISFLKKYIRLLWLVILIPALIWGFAHSFYQVFPTYVRGIELTIFGIVLGIVFLKYGVTTVIIAHFVINATLASLQLLKTHNLYLVTTVGIVIALAFVPIVMLCIFKKRKR